MQLKHCILIISGCISFAFTQTDPKVLNEKGKEYYEKGMYKEAETTLLQAIKISKQSENKSDEIIYSMSLSRLANVYVIEGKFPQADSLFQKAVELQKIVAETSSLEHAETLSDWAFLKIQQEKYDNVEDLLSKAISIRKKKLGKKHPDYGESLGYLGYYYLCKDNIKKAEKLLWESTAILLGSLGQDDPRFARSLFLLGDYYFYTGDFSSTRKYYDKGNDIHLKIFGEDHPEYANGLIRCITLEAVSGNYDEAIQLAQKALPVYENSFGTNHPEYIGILVDIGAIYFKIGEYKTAEPILLNTLELVREYLGESHSYYFTTLNSLSLLYIELNSLEKAESLLLESLHLRRNLYGNSGLKVANALNNLGTFYMELGNRQDAEYYFKEALNIMDKRGESPDIYAIIMSNLGKIYSEKGDYKKALSAMEEAASLQKKHLGEYHPDYLNVLNNIAVNKMNINDKDPSIEKLYLEVLHKRKSVLGESHPDYAMSLNNLAYYYQSKEAYEKAEELYKESLKIIPENNPNYSKFISNLAANYELSGDYANAWIYYSKYFQLIKKQTNQNFMFLTEKEREMYWNPMKGVLIYLQRFTNEYKKMIPALSGLAYDCELLTKSLLLNSSQQVERSILSSEDENLINLWEKTKELKHTCLKFDNLLMKGLGVTSSSQLEESIMNAGDEELIETWRGMDTLKREVAQWEKDIMKWSKEYRNQQNDFTLQWQDIRQALNEKEVAIEFFNYWDFDLKTIDTVIVKYCALILRPEYEYPEMITLCNFDILEDAIRQSPYDGKNVYELIWKPLEKYLEDANEIYMAPSGLLHAVSFSGIKKEDHYLGDEFIIHHLLSTKDIISIKGEKESSLKNNQAVFFGGADFSLSNAELAQIDTDLTARPENLTRSMLESLDATRGQGFDYLPGSRKEVQTIGKQLSGLQWETALFTDKNATETRFKSFSSSQSPRLLHVSTHGFYFPSFRENPEKFLRSSDSPSIYRTTDNPLMRSGLAFAGANQAWSGKDVADNIDDGILTAYEVSNMNLANTELVVLSACETGLGEVVGSEGVYGLQRGFRLAGVQSMIVSLWKVPDKETVELMTEFYSLWNKGASKKEALDGAQNKLKKSYPDQPEKWAGFVLIE